MKIKYKVITLFNATGIYEAIFLSGYENARKWYEENKKDNLVLLSIMINEKGKVLHVFDHVDQFIYDKGRDYFKRKDWGLDYEV